MISFLSLNIYLQLRFVWQPLIWRHTRYLRVGEAAGRITSSYYNWVLNSALLKNVQELTKLSMFYKYNPVPLLVLTTIACCIVLFSGRLVKLHTNVMDTLTDLCETRCYHHGLNGCKASDVYWDQCKWKRGWRQLNRSTHARYYSAGTGASLLTILVFQSQWADCSVDLIGNYERWTSLHFRIKDLGLHPEISNCCLSLSLYSADFSSAREPVSTHAVVIAPR
jgi:hypothetical protein